MWRWQAAGLAISVCLSLAPARIVRAEDGPDDTSAGPPSVRVTGYLESDTAYRILSPNTFQKSQNRLEVEIDAHLAESLRLQASGWLLWDPIALLVGRSHDFPEKPWSRWQINDSRRVDAELREFTLDWSGHLGGARLDLRLGAQEVVWGQSLGLRILDVVNPQDFREFVLEDFSNARTPLIGLNAEVWLSGWSLQGLVFPTFEPNQLPDPTAEFAMNPQLDGFLPSLATFMAPPAVPQPVALINLESEANPKNWRFNTAGYGFRAARSFSGVDLGLYYWDAFDPMQAWDRQINYIPLPGGLLLPVNRLQPVHVRTHTLGASFSTALGGFTLWGEGTVAFGRSFPASDLTDENGRVTRTEASTVIGLDWAGLDTLFVNLQWIEGLMTGSTSEVAADPLRSYFTLLVRWPLRNETVIPQLFTLYGVDHREAMLRPSIVWKATDRLSVTAGLDYFLGESKGLFGQYAHARECTVVPSALPVSSAGSCVPDVRPGRPSRVYLAVSYAFDFAI